MSDPKYLLLPADRARFGHVAALCSNFRWAAWTWLPTTRSMMETVGEITGHATAALRARLLHVYWVGGGSGAGKSTIARRVADRHGLCVYATDNAMTKHDGRFAPHETPLLSRFKAMDMDERWLNRSPEIMFESFHWFRGELFGLVVEDLLRLPAEPGVIAEGCMQEAGRGPGCPASTRGAPGRGRVPYPGGRPSTTNVSRLTKLARGSATGSTFGQDGRPGEYGSVDDWWCTSDRSGVEVISVTATPDRHDGESFGVSHYGFHVGYARSVAELGRCVELADWRRR